MASQVSEEFHTLYVNNLNEKVPKQELRAALHAVFSPFGKVLDIVTANTYRLRGQAWIVYDTSMDANNAMQSLQSFPFYDKPMKIVVANTTSDAIRRRRGEHIERDGAVRLSRKVENQERERLRRKNATAENATRHEPKAMDGMKRPPSTRIAVQGLPGKSNGRRSIFIQLNREDTYFTFSLS